MPETVAFFSLHHEYFTVLVAAIFSFFFSFPKDLNPVTAIEIIFQQIGHKTNLESRSNSYKHLASILSIFIIFLPLSLIISQLFEIALEPWIVNFSMLFLLLSWHDKKQQYHLIFDALTHQKFAKAKYHLNEVTLREIKPLSILGINKATIESMLFQFSVNWFSVLFWYFMAGIYGALFYRVIQICAQQWNQKLTQFDAISKIPSFIYSVMLFPVHLLLNFTFQFYDKPFKNFISKFKQSIDWHHFSSGLMLASFGLSLQIQLGGVRLYKEKKVTYANLGSKKSPNVKDIGKALQRLTLSAWMWLSCFTIYSFFPAFVQFFSA